MWKNLSYEERFKMLVETVSDVAVIGINTDGMIGDWNQGARNLLGYEAAEILGKPAALIFTPEDREKGIPEKEMSDSRETGSAVDERWHIRKDGSLFWGSGTMKSIRKDGRLIGYLKVFRDLTRMKNLTDQLKKTNEDLEQFAAMASHDLQAPLTQILMFISLIRTKPAGIQKEIEEELTCIQKSAAQMQMLIRDLLFFYRAGELAPGDLQDVDLNGVVFEAMNNLKAQIDQKKPEFEIDPLPRVKARRTQMVQLFQNLIDNAVKYSDGPGKKPHVKVKSVKEDGFDVVRVEDNGIGFDPENVNSLFKPFKRLHGKKFQGTGLGLAICRKIVDKYGGDIKAESKPNEGSVFTVKFPRTTPPG